MSAPTDPADYDACDEHEQAYPRGEACPECVSPPSRGPAPTVDYLVMDSRAIDDFDEAMCHEVCESLAEAKRRAPVHGDYCCVFSVKDGAACFEWQHVPVSPMSGAEVPSLAEALVSGPRVCDCEGATRADEDGCCVSCGLDHRAFETPTLTTEQARALAERWVFLVNWRPTCAEDEEAGPAIWTTTGWEQVTLTDLEREQLFAWARARMVDGANVREPGSRSRVALAAYVEAELDPGVLEGKDPFGFEPAWALCEAAGWPS